ncbi:MAG TPA: three-Cys-motif partner protein TcmP, partial [Edaphobacter sp.]|uniref:three-Cys-motif partner protein TcmP n=1 Tax=Edaphobacter sp. TaxID=1934404 RepID=UPI002B53F2A6
LWAGMLWLLHLYRRGYRINGSPQAEAVMCARLAIAVPPDQEIVVTQADRTAAACLRLALTQRGYSDRIDKDLFLLNSEFESNADQLIEHVRRKMPRSQRAIFLLDQYGYSEVPTERIARIIQSLPGSEVILTFAIDALLTYFSERSEITRGLLQKMGIPEVLRGRSFEDIKRSETDWRLMVQSCLYQELVERCQAKYYTLFFIRSDRGHGDYWLIHFSQNPRARDVMTRIHWQNNNHFIHYGGPGLDMFRALGYVSKNDDQVIGYQHSLFEFDEDAKQASTDGLVAQIGPMIYADSDGMTFGELFATTCNLSPASADIYRDAIDILRGHREIEVISSSTSKATQARIQDGDRIVISDQRNLFLPR